jgi:hypothetical protein
MRKRILPIALVLVLTVPLVWLLRGFARDVFLVELIRLLWGARMVFESLPQLPMWALFIVTVLVIAVRSLSKEEAPTREMTERKVQYEGPVQMLTRWIQRAAEGEYFRWSLAQHLGGLTWEVMAHRGRTTPEELKEQLRAGRLDVPPVVQAYIESPRRPGSATSAGFMARVRERLQSGKPAPAPDPALEAVIDFLERQLEVGPLPEIEHHMEVPYEH